MLGESCGARIVTFLITTLLHTGKIIQHLFLSWDDNKSSFWTTSTHLLETVAKKQVEPTSMCWLCWVYYLDISVLRYGSLVAPNSFCTLMMTQLDTQPRVLAQSMMVQMNEGTSCTYLPSATADGIQTTMWSKELRIWTAKNGRKMVVHHLCLVRE